MVSINDLMENNKYYIKEGGIFDIIKPVRLVTSVSAHKLLGAVLVFQPVLTEVYTKYVNNGKQNYYIYSIESLSGLYKVHVSDFKSFVSSTIENTYEQSIVTEPDATRLALYSTIKIYGVIGTKKYPDYAYEGYDKFEKRIAKFESDNGHESLYMFIKNLRKDFLHHSGVNPRYRDNNYKKFEASLPFELIH